MRKWLVCLVLGVYFAIGSVAWAEPQIPPAPSTGSVFVQDYAGVLSGDTKSRIDNLGNQLQAKTKAHVTVVTVKTLNGNPISEYALAILRQWGVGDKALNNGVVIVVVADPRQPSPRTRIEVGYGLEGALPDAKTGRILDDYMIPSFTQGDYDQGILRGYQAVIGEVAKEYNVEINIQPSAQAQQPSQSWWDGLPWWLHIAVIAGLLLLFAIDWLFFGGTFTFLLLSLFRGGRGGGGFGGGGGGGGGAER